MATLRNLAISLLYLATSERIPMITVHNVELRAGARLLLSGISFTVSPGDRIGLVGRNGAGLSWRGSWRKRTCGARTTATWPLWPDQPSPAEETRPGRT
jgi:hypothetical protein